MDMKLEQEDRFRLLVQAQDEDRRAIRSLLGREEFPVAAPTIAHVPLMRMGPHDDPEAFVDLFEKTAEACGWARTQWPVRLIPLLTGEAQVAAQQLPVANLLAYEDLKRAILQRVGRNPEQHRQRFRSVELGDSGRPFVMAQQLRDACRKWLMAESRNVEGVIDLVVLEQFIVRLPRRTAEWVQCHRPTSLTQAIQLAEDHMVACPGVGEPRSNRSLSPSLSPPSLPSLSRPVPAPRSRVQAAPRAPPRSGNGQGDRWPRRGGGAEPTAAPPSSLRQSLAYPSAAGAAVRPGPACWRCGDPGHFQDHCPMMEVGLLVRVPDSPTAAPDQAGQYQIPVSIKGGTYQALVDSGCNQTSIHQSLMQQRALDMSRKVKVRCVHGDVADYPLVPVSIKFRGKTHRMEVAVNSHLKHPLILGTDWQRHMEHLRAVLRSLREAGLTANPRKCAIGRVEVRYLGFHLGHGQVRPQIDKTAAVAACPSPKTKKEVRQFLGLAGYYRRFIPNFSDLTSPLTDLTKKEAPDPVQWTEPCQQALTKVKAALCGGPLLHSPNFDLPFLLQTDASDRGLGAVLAQVVGGEERPVLYLSRKLSKRETRYSTVEKECLAIRWAVLTLRYYLLGREFTLCSDHAPLQWLHRMKDTNARITRWYLALQPFKFKVVHRPGVQMAVADFLSRNRGGGGGGAAGRRTHRPETGGGGMWRGERGKAERARGRAGSETSGETIGKWMMTNTCV